MGGRSAMYVCVGSGWRAADEHTTRAILPHSNDLTDVRGVCRGAVVTHEVCTMYVRLEGSLRLVRGARGV